MKQEFVKYLESIGIYGALIARIGSIYEFFRHVCGEEIADIVVAEYVKEDESREYEELWFFSANLAMLADHFVTGDDFRLLPIRNVILWKIQKSEYDFEKATAKSRMILEFHMPGTTFVSIRASRENCDHLRDVFIKHVVPNVVRDG